MEQLYTANQLEEIIYYEESQNLRLNRLL